MVQENSMRKIVIITGLTGSGKSALALDIADRYNGEIVSADSVQIYRGLDIGSAKESLGNRARIPHHLIDIKEFDETYNVGEFLIDCERAIHDIIARGKLPIIVGGTGLYVKALIEGYSLGGAVADSTFRQHYEHLASEHGKEYVWDILNKKNPTKAQTVHYNNLKRVVRYLELEEYGEPEQTKSILYDFNILAIGIVADRDVIYNRINQRVDIMIHDGLETEVNNLIKQGATSTMQSMNTIGYKEWFDHVSGNVSRDDTINLIKQHTRNYCKRQLTFMKTIRDLEMLTIVEAKKRIEEFL